jgi:hypothetical protein
MRAAIFALAGFALLVVGMFDFVYGGGVAALFVWPLAIVLEIVAAFLAVRILGRGESGAGRGAAIGALVVALASGGLAVVGLLALFAPKR